MEIIFILAIVLGAIEMFSKATKKRVQVAKEQIPITPTKTMETDFNQELLQLQKIDDSLGLQKNVQENYNIEQPRFVRSKGKMFETSNPYTTKLEVDPEHLIALDKTSVLQGVIFSVILSPPKSKKMESIF